MKLTTTLFFSLSAAAFLLSACTNYGDKVSKDFVEVYYKENITKEQAQQTLDLLYPSWNESSNQKSVQLTKSGDTVNFRMVINEEKAKDIKDESYLLLTNGISSSVFKGSPVNVDLTNDKFETIRTLRYKKMDAEDYGTKINSGNIDVYAKDGFNEKQAETLAAFIDQMDGDAADTKSFQATGSSDGVYTISMVSSPERSAALPEKEFYDLAGLLSDSVFSGAPLILHLTDDMFKPYQTFRHNIKSE
jgi:hypothetical protein